MYLFSPRSIQGHFTLLANKSSPTLLQLPVFIHTQPLADRLPDNIHRGRGWRGRHKHQLRPRGGGLQAASRQQPHAGRLVPRHRQRPPLHHQQLLRQAPRDGRRRGSPGSFRFENGGSGTPSLCARSSLTSTQLLVGLHLHLAAGNLLRSATAAPTRLPPLSPAWRRPHPDLHRAALDSGCFKAGLGNSDRPLEVLLCSASPHRYVPLYPAAFPVWGRSRG